MVEVEARSVVGKWKISYNRDQQTQERLVCHLPEAVGSSQASGKMRQNRKLRAHIFKHKYKSEKANQKWHEVFNLKALP